MMRNTMSSAAVLGSAAIGLAWAVMPFQDPMQRNALIGQRMTDVVRQVGVPDAATAGRLSTTLTWQTDGGSPQSVEEGNGVGLQLHYADGTDVWVAHGYVLGVTQPR